MQATERDRDAMRVQCACAQRNLSKCTRCNEWFLAGYMLYLVTLLIKFVDMLSSEGCLVGCDGKADTWCAPGQSLYGVSCFIELRFLLLIGCYNEPVPCFHDSVTGSSVFI